MDIEGIKARARKRLRAIERMEAKPRFRNVIGRYVAAGVLTVNYPVELNRDPILVKDVLWAGQFEPRLLELLPALIVKKPSLFVEMTELPADLAAAVDALSRNEVPSTFRGIDGKSLYQWLPRVGHRGKVPSRLKSFRFRADDQQLLDELQQRLGGSQMDVLRRALQQLDHATRHG